MLLVVAILLQLATSYNMRKDNHHILIKNLSTNEEQGFMLASGDTPYSIQGVDNVAQRVQDWEILYSDFTNSRVFAQSEWSEGVSRYWDPEKNGFYIFPSKKYKDKKNITIGEWEFTLGGNVSEEFDIPYVGWEGPMCKWETAWVVYLGSGMQLYRSTDFGNTWSVFKDFTGIAQLSDVDEITDITYINTEPTDAWNYGGSMWSIALSNIQCLFVAFYNRITKVSGMARYDISFTYRWALWTTFKYWWATSSAHAFWAIRSSITCNTSWVSSGTVAAYKVNNPNEFTMWATWSSSGLYPGQKIKMTRIATWIVSDVIIGFVGWLFWWDYSIGVYGLPSYDATTDANNFYTISEIGKNSTSICLPLWSWWIEVYTNIGYWLWQNVIYNGITYNICGLWNWWDRFWDLPGYYPWGNSSYVPTGYSDFVKLLRIDGWDAWTWIYWNGSQTLSIEKWIYKYGTYNNRVTKFARVEKTLSHIWGYNHIDPEDKFYDVAYGEMTNDPAYSNIYANSFNGILHSLQNHTATIANGYCPISAVWYGTEEWATALENVLIYFGTQNWPLDNGTQSLLWIFTLNDNIQWAPTYNYKSILWAAWLTSMVFFSGRLYIGSKKRWMIYELFDNKLTELAQLPRDEITGEAIIDSMTTFAGKIICSYQKWSGIYTLDPTSRQNAAPLIETDVLCSVETLSNARIYNICNIGGMLLFTEWDKVYSYDQDGIASYGYMESSIYGGYISNVDKLWIYAYVRIDKWELEDGQRVAMQVSLDEGHSWNYMPRVAWKPFSATNPWNDIYSIGHDDTDNQQQLTFFFPYNTKSGTILYRCWLKKWTTVKPVVNHIGVHYNLNYRQELLFNYQLDLNKAMELLGGRTIEKDLQGDKLAFLKNIWQNQDMVLLTDVTGKKYTCMPFSDDRTPWQGLVISTSNSNTAHLDLDNLTYRVAFSLKTIANYEKVL